MYGTEPRYNEQTSPVPFLNQGSTISKDGAY